MRSCFARLSLLSFLVGVLVSCGFASPASSKLLSLVPAGSEIVAGLENRHDAASSGHLFLTTRNNRLDLDDWLALAGVDTARIFDEVIEVAGSVSSARLAEHLLLVSGRFDRERIFRAAEQNGSQAIDYKGYKVLVIKPFERELREMFDTRWLIILSNQTALFGTPLWVQESLRRYATHALPDMILEERLLQLHPDVRCWNVLVQSKTQTKSITFARPRTAWARLMDDAEVMLVGARFGPSTRVDFMIFANHGKGTAFFTEKAGILTELFAEDVSQLPTGLAVRIQSHLEAVNVGSDRVEGSVAISSSQFDAWANQLSILMANRNAAPKTVAGLSPATE
jgi:hypothetical protein